MVKYRAEMYEDFKSFENGLNDMAAKGYILHSFQRHEGLFYKYIAVFYKGA